MKISNSNINKAPFLFPFLLLCSCQPFQNSTPDSLELKTMKDLQWQDNQAFYQSSPKKKKRNCPPKPQGEQEKRDPLFNQRVSIAITENLPLKTALLMLSQRTGINLQLDPSIQVPLIYSAHNQPLHEVIQDICDLAQLRYVIHNTNLKIVPDTPYPENYKINFLNFNRKIENNTSISTNIFSQQQDGQQVSNGSNSNLSATTDNDFWGELEKNLRIILENTPEKPPARSPKPPHHSSEDSSDNSSDATDHPKNFTIHRQGGILTVRGTSRQHKLVSSYLKRLKQTISTQILIEAKVIEINLKDQFKAGINWSEIGHESFQAFMPLGKIAQTAKVSDPLQHGHDILSIGTRTGHFSAILQAIQQFGSCKTLSSPRLTVLNNQNAILKVAQNQVYFRLRYDRENNTNINRENVVVTSDIQTVPIGLVMSVQPSIDPDTNKILLSLRPTISRLTRSVPDPAVDIFYAMGATQHHHNHDHHVKSSMVPIVEVREIDSILEVESGSIAILGGLMESRKASEDSKLPGLGDIPLLGKLVSAQSETEEVVELVILLKATLVEDNQFSDQLTTSDDQLMND